VVMATKTRKAPGGSGRPFERGSKRAREAGRRGGRATSAMRRKCAGPYKGSILDAMDAALMTDASWEPWRTVMRVVFGLPLSQSNGELERYRKHTSRQDPPPAVVAEAWVVAGRRAGKSRMAALIALYCGIRFDASTSLAPGELATVPLLAADRKQGRVVMSYLKALCQLPAFHPYVHRVLRGVVELRTSVNVEVATASFRTIRGYTVPAAVLDEVAFWRDESTSTNPDSEILDALRPGMATVKGSLLFAISSPYARRGELYSTYERYYGQEDPYTLVWNSDTQSLNPTVPDRVLERAYAEDPLSAASEYGQDGRVEFRRDVEAFVDSEALAAVTVQDRLELPPLDGTRYSGFTDPSGGSKDSFTVAVGHLEGADRAVLDCVRERRPPFSPDAVVEEFATLLQSYGVYSVVGDRYAGEWPQERFRKHGIAYNPSERVKSEIYREIVAPLNAGRIELLDLPVLRAQLLALERRTARGGKDSVDHPPGGRDDIANAAAGVLVNVLPTVSRKKKLRWA